MFARGQSKLVDHAKRERRAAETTQQSSKRVSNIRVWTTPLKAETLGTVHKLLEVDRRQSVSISASVGALPKRVPAFFFSSGSKKLALLLRSAVSEKRDARFHTTTPAGAARVHAHMAY